MTFVLMFIATVAWLWKGAIELSLIICAWAIWLETISGSTVILSKLIPSDESVKKAQEIINSLKKGRE